MRLFPRRRPNVDQLRRRGDLGGLRSAMRYEEIATDRAGVAWDMGVPVRVEATRALSEFYGPTVAEGLSEGIADRHPQVRLAAVEGIASLGVPIAAQGLVDGVVRWGQPDDAAAAARALQTLTAWPVEGLPEALVHSLLVPEAPALEDRHRDALRSLLAGDPRAAAAGTATAVGLIGFLSMPGDPEGHRRAEEVLGWLGPAAADAMIEAFDMGTAAPAVARAAAVAEDSRLVHPLVLLVGDADAEMRRAAAIGLQGLNNTRAVPVLMTATQDSEQAVRDAASAALNTMGTAAVIVGLGTLLARRNGELEGAEGEAGSLTDDPEWAERVMARLLRSGD